MKTLVPTPKSDWPWIVGILLLAAALRALHLIHLPLDSDHAIVGLMAMHMLDGEFTPMYWGSDYGGTQETWIAAAVFWIFGPSRPALGASAMIPGLAFLVGLYLTGKEIWSRRAGLAAMFLAALGPYYLVWHQTIPRAFYSTALALCVFLIWTAARMVHRQPGTKAYAWYAVLFGFLAGQAIWAHPFTGGVVAATGLIIWRADPKLIIRPRLALMAGGLVLGCLPWLYYNFTHNWQTIHYILSPKPKLGVLADLKAVFGGGLPVLMGLTDYLGQGWAMPGLRLVLLAVSLGLAMWLLWRWGGQLAKRAASARQGDGSEILLLSALGIVGMFIAVGGSASFSYRYLIFFYAVLPLALGWGFDQLWRPGRAWRAAAWAGLTMFAVLNLSGSVAATPLLDAKWRRDFLAIQANTNQLVDYLADNGRGYAFTTDYWLAKRITFDSAEKVILARAVRDRYQPYFFGALRSGSNAFVARRDKDAASADSTLKAMGAEFKVRVVGGGYRVFMPVKPPETRPFPVSPTGFSARSSEGPSPGRRAWDLVASTRWRTGGAQKPGDWFVIDLGREVADVCQLLLLAGLPREQPPGLQLQGSLDGTEWQRLGGWESAVWPALWSGDKPVIMEDAPWQEIRFAPRPLRYLRLRVVKGKPNAYWGLAEVLVGAAEPRAADSNPAKAGRWVSRSVKTGPVWCEPILQAWLRPELRVQPLASFRPPWMPAYLTPRNAIAPDQPVTMAVRRSMLAQALAVLKQCGWRASHQVRHGFALITAEPPKGDSLAKAAGVLKVTGGADGWKIDLGAEVDIAGLVLHGADPRLPAGGPRVTVSIDGAAWQEVKPVTRRPPQLYWAGFMPLIARAHPVELRFARVKARWVRLAMARPLPKGLGASLITP